jgi:hypothetical protein
MFRASTFQRTMARLALISVLLMALAPVMSRWMAGNSTQWLSGLVELCTTDGLKLVDLSAFNSDGDATLPGTGHSGMEADCAYCPLLAGTALLLLVLAALFPRALVRLVPVAAPLSSPPSSLFPGLGSRGPPLFS